MSCIPFQPPAPPGRAAALPQEFDAKRGPAGRAGVGRGGGQRHRWRAGDCPAGLRRAGPGLGTEPQHDHPPPGPFRRKREAAAGGEIIRGEPPFSLDQHHAHPRAARRLQPGAQHIQFAARIDNHQPGGIDPEQEQPIAAGYRGKPPQPTPAARQNHGARGGRAAQREGERQRRRPVLRPGMEFVQVPGIEPGQLTFCLEARAAACGPGQSDYCACHGPNRLCCSYYVPCATARPVSRKKRTGARR